MLNLISKKKKEIISEHSQLYLIRSSKVLLLSNPPNLQGFDHMVLLYLFAERLQLIPRFPSVGMWCKEFRDIFLVPVKTERNAAVNRLISYRLIDY